MIAANLDAILEFISNDENKSQIFMAYSIKENVFPELNEDQVTHMILEINRLKPEICTIETDGRPIIYSNGLTIPFLEKGGFKALFDEDIAKEIRRKEIEDIELELAKSNIKANKLNTKIAKRNKRETVINILIGLLNVGLLAWQLLKAG